MKLMEGCCCWRRPSSSLQSLPQLNFPLEPKAPNRGSLQTLTATTTREDVVLHSYKGIKETPSHLGEIKTQAWRCFFQEKRGREGGELVEFFVSFDVPSSGFVLSEMSTGIVEKAELQIVEKQTLDTHIANMWNTVITMQEKLVNMENNRRYQHHRVFSHWLVQSPGDQPCKLCRPPGTFLMPPASTPCGSTGPSYRDILSLRSSSGSVETNNCKKDLSNMQIKRAGKLSTRPVRKGTATSSSGLLQIAAEFHGEMHQRQESLSEPTHEAEKFIKEDVELLRMSLSKPSSSEPLHEAKKSIKEDRELLRRSGPVLEL
ncbi:hypothetical protein SELMODRAFT_430959 [Selaginella moellendorffii]|uniref:Uncharacterized protein n=1 Tax=Selaginella moellendorffii TaxID=88036 RepID=D8TB28_SELML|nr:hypothetical protein SELMODRAFT_430959 [Selaginella moellendorffii]